MPEKQTLWKVSLIYLMLAFYTKRTKGATVFFTSTIPTTSAITSTTIDTTTLPYTSTPSDLVSQNPANDTSIGFDSSTSKVNTQRYTDITTSTQPVTIVSRLGLSCVDRNDPSFITPRYCKFSANQMLVTRDADGNGFDFVYPGAFDGLDIRILNLSSLGLRNLNSSSFKGLSNLNTIYLDNNEINDLPQDLFTDLRQLSYIYLGSNLIKEVKAGLLANQRTLRELSLSNNMISSIDDGTFESQEMLEKLHLDGNLITEINKDNFRGLKELQLLNLGSNQIRNLPTDVFEYLSWLQTLNLTRNILQFVPDGAFANLTFNFMTLDLSFNEIKDLGDKAFFDKRRLSEVYLNDNQLTEIKRNTFTGLDGMSSIYFQNNRISVLKSESLSGLTQLKKLILSNNSISYLPVGWMDALGNLEVVDLSYNIISRVDATPFKTPIKLRELDFSFNRLQFIEHDWFDTNDGLEILKFRGNSLTSLPNDIFKVANKIKTLDLGSNRFKQEALTNKFLNLTALKVLRLDNNSMTLFDADNARCQALLEELYLNSSCLERVFVAGFSNLKKLDLRGNYLKSVNLSYISGLTNLQHLDVSDNNITLFDFKSFENYYKLTVLNLSMNLLTNVDSSSLIPTSSNQATFDFSWNSLTDLSTFPNIYKFKIASESLQCSCGQLPQWKSLDSFADFRQTVCSEGTNLHFLACYLTNSSRCQVRSEPNSTYLTDWCNRSIPSIDSKTRPIVYKESCEFPKPEIINFNLINTTKGFEVAWNVTNIKSLKWFTLKWKQESQNIIDNSTDSLIVLSKTTSNVFRSLLQSGETTVCLATEPVYSFIPKSEQCGQFNFTAPLTATPSNDSSGIPFWVWIIVALGILILLLFLIILIAVCIRRSRNKRLEKERLEVEKKTKIPRAPSFTSSPFDPNLPQDTAEQTVVSLDMYQNAPVDSFIFEIKTYR